jgi:thioredoxin-related protein
VAKPVVDRLENELESQAEVIRVNVMSGLGMTLARRYGVRATPTLLVFDGAGKVVYAQAGVPHRDAIHAAVAELAAK